MPEHLNTCGFCPLSLVVVPHSSRMVLKFLLLNSGPASLFLNLYWPQFPNQRKLVFFFRRFVGYTCPHSSQCSQSANLGVLTSQNPYLIVHAGFEALAPKCGTLVLIFLKERFPSRGSVRKGMKDLFSEMDVCSIMEWAAPREEMACL